jgi:hypothetical protein
MDKTILVPLDGSKRAETVLSHAEEILPASSGKRNMRILEQERALLIEHYHEAVEDG